METRLTFIENAGSISYKKGTCLLIKCKCICGKIVVIRKQKFTSGHTKSCGCLQKEKTSELSKTHGMSYTSEYKIWAGMLTRCTNKKAINYQNYGGRGIGVCERWNDFSNFLQDMGIRPSKNHSLDRIDNNDNYYKDNCKWSTKIEQCSNKRVNRKYNYKNNILTVTEISRITGIKRATISNWANRSKYSKEKIEQLIIENDKTAA